MMRSLAKPDPNAVILFDSVPADCFERVLKTKIVLQEAWPVAAWYQHWETSCG